MPAYLVSRTSISGVNYILGMMSSTNPFLYILALSAPLCVVLLIFAYQNSSRSTTAINALPLNSRQLFFTNALAGWLLFMIPIAIMSVIFLIPIKLPGSDEVGFAYNVYSYREIFPNGIMTGATVNTLPVVSGFFIRTAITFSLYYSIYLLAASVTGNGIVTVLISGLLQLFSLGVYIVFHSICYLYVLGYDDSGIFGDVFVKYASLFHPVALDARMTSIPLGSEFALEATNTPIKNDWLPIWSSWLIYVLFAAALLALACYSATHRKQERAGDSIVFGPVKNAVIFIASLCGMYLMGMFFINMFASESAMYVGFAIGFVVAYFVSWMIAERTLNVLYKFRDLIKFGGCAIALLLIAIGITRLDLFGFERKIPDISEIKGAYNSQYPSSGYSGHDESYSSLMAILDGERMLTGEETLKALMALHKSIIDDRQNVFRHHIDYVTNSIGRQTTYAIRYERLQFTWMLNDGTSLSRTYTLPYDYYISVGGFDFEAREEVILSQYPSYRRMDLVNDISVEMFQGKNYEILNGADPLYGNMYKDPSYNNYHITITNKEHMKALVEEVKKDIVATIHDEMNEQRESYKTVNRPVAEQLDTYVEIYANIRLNSDGGYSPPATYDHTFLSIYDNTLAWLLNNGYLRELYTDDKA
jgi:hypothetical protein